MQTEGKVRFLKYHDKAVKSVSFNPVERYIFCSGSADGKLNIYGSYNSSFHYLLVSYPLGRELNGVKFTADGRRILTALQSKKLAVLDVETGQPTNCYDSCCYGGNSRDFVRIPIVTDKNSPFLAVSPSISNRGLTLYDTRMPLVYEFMCDLFVSDIRDIIFFDSSWPFVPKNSQGIASITKDGQCSIVSVTGKVLNQFEVGHRTNTIARTPESFDQMTKAGFKSTIMIAGDHSLSSYTPEQASYENMNKIFSRTFGLVNHSSLSTNFGIQEYLSHLHFGLNVSPNSASNTFQSTISNSSSINSNRQQLLASNSSRRSSSLIKTMHSEKEISQLKYGSNGGLLYSTSNSPQSYCVQKYRRYPNEHRLIAELYSHKSEIYDFDISPYDEFLVTASRDRTVGVMLLGSPNRGTTSTSELT